MSQILKTLQEQEDSKYFSNDGDVSQDNVKANLFDNCMYIVSAILIENGKVLLISEAKPRHYGQWYLPAGKVEKQESLITAFKRELLEESFFEGEPDHLLSVEARPGGWSRYNFVGHKTGGRLKTWEDKDKDSLEANWFDISQVLHNEIDLRATDILPLIDDANLWLQQNAMLNQERSLPLLNSYLHTCCRAILLDVGSDSSMKMAVYEDSSIVPVLPLSSCNDTTIAKFYEKHGLNVNVMGLMAVEHSPREETYDGVCFNFLCMLSGKFANTDSFTWIQLDSQLSVRVKNLIKEKAFVMVK